MRIDRYIAKNRVIDIESTDFKGALAELLNVCDLSSYVGPRVAPDCPTRIDGRIAPPEGPGLGVTPDPSVLGDAVLEIS